MGASRGIKTHFFISGFKDRDNLTQRGFQSCDWGCKGLTKVNVTPATMENAACIGLRRIKRMEVNVFAGTAWIGMRK